MITKIPTVTYTFRDGAGSAGTMRFNVRFDTPVSVAMAAADELRLPLSELSLCEIERQSVIYTRTELDYTRPNNQSNIRRAGIFVFETTLPDEYAIIEIPSIRQELLIEKPGKPGIAVDVDSPAIDTFVESVIAAYSNQWAYKITNLAAALLSRE